ncbi:MAG: heavy metal translocating P-type ATPase [Halocynthiibacter sp.]
MSVGMASRPSACPACDAAPSAEALAKMSLPTEANLMLSLPTIHCAICIEAVERALNARDDVHEARVNLTLKRVSVEAEPEVEATDLIKTLAAVGYEAHELDAGSIRATQTDKSGRDLLMRLGVAGFAMMNVMLLSVSVWSGAESATRDLFHWISALIALPTIAFSGQPFFKNAYGALSVGRLNMDVPISLAILLAGGMSLYETMQHGEHAYFDAALSLTFFLLAGRYLDHRTRAVARSAAEELAALEVPRATRLTTDGMETVPISALEVGDIVEVKPGARMPVDGIVIKGATEIDRSLLTGETLPVFVSTGAEVSTGEVNLTGPLEVRTVAAGEDSSLHRMANLVAVAESSKNRYTSLADRAAKIYAPAVHLLALGAFLVWLAITYGDVRYALNIAVAVLIITCPCALGLAVPAVTTAASGRLFKQGLLIKDPTALERLAEVDTVVFDKTGTLTYGRPKPVGMDTVEAPDLMLAFALARGSSHPLSQALSDYCVQNHVQLVALENVKEVAGYGVEGEYEGQLVRLGRAEWVGAVPQNHVATYLSIEGQDAVVFRFEDQLREGCEAAISALKSAGKEIYLLSGDVEGPVQALAKSLGIDHAIHGALPEEKAQKVAALAAENKRVLMVGDGLNDTAALSAAHVSISPASALDAARVASDVVLMGQDLNAIPEALIVAKKATRRIKENFAIAAGYNFIAVPIALIGLATPLAAALAMSFSSITVSVNALRLR